MFRQRVPRQSSGSERTTTVRDPPIIWWHCQLIIDSRTKMSSWCSFRDWYTMGPHYYRAEIYAGCVDAASYLMGHVEYAPRALL